MTDVWLAVDGGNTKTLAIVFDATGQVMGVGRSGNVDLYGASSESHAIGELLAVVSAALSSAQVGASQVRHAAFRLAGVDWPEDAVTWREVIARSLPELSSFSVDSDAFGPLRMVAPDGVGVSVVLGTGPAVAARNGAGDAVTLGWWLRDPLGAVGLGEAAVSLVYRAHLGFTDASALTAAVLQHLEEPTAETLLHSFTRHGSSRGWRDYASLGPVVSEHAAGGDPDATHIIREQAALVARYTLSAARRVGLEDAPVPIALAGSVLASPGSPMAAALSSELAILMPHAEPRVPSGLPVHGVALEAWAESGTVTSPALLARLLAADVV